MHASDLLSHPDSIKKLIKYLDRCLNLKIEVLLPTGSKAKYTTTS